jgi:toxin ParE1/3/4
MKYRIRSTPPVELDIEEASDWYETERAGLGNEFLFELGAVYDRIEENPLKLEVLRFDIRRALLRRFPYAVYFILDNELIVVLAVLHTARDPARWQERKSHRISEL